jgi:hypothetical protein
MKKLNYLRGSLLVLPLLMISGCGDDPENEGNHLPTVSILDKEQTVNAGEEVTISAKAFDVDGDALTYLWTLKSKPQESETVLRNAQTKEVSMIPDEGGNYILSFVANDGLSDSKSVTATVRASSPDPVAPDNSGVDGQAKGIVGVWTIDMEKANDVVRSYEENDPRGLFVGLLISGMKDIRFKEDGTCSLPDLTQESNGKKCWGVDGDNYIFYGSDGEVAGTMEVNDDILILRLDENENTDDTKIKSTELEYSRVDE